MKKFLPFLLVLLGIFGTSWSSKAAFMNEIYWGMSPEEVIEYEGAPYKIIADQETIYLYYIRNLPSLDSNSNHPDEKLDLSFLPHQWEHANAYLSNQFLVGYFFYNDSLIHMFYQATPEMWETEIGYFDLFDLESAITSSSGKSPFYKTMSAINGKDRCYWFNYNSFVILGLYGPDNDILRLSFYNPIIAEIYLNNLDEDFELTELPEPINKGN